MSESGALALGTYFAIQSGDAEAAALRLLVELGVQIAKADEGSLLVLDEERGDLVFAMTVGHADDGLLGQRVPLGHGVTGLAAATGEVQLGAPTFDVEEQERVGDGAKPKSVIAAPLLIEDETVGVLTAISFDRDRRFGRDDASLYGKLATAAALIVRQRQRLAALEKGARSGGDHRSATEARIVSAVGRLSQARPENLEAVASLLESLGMLALGKRA